MRFTGVWSLRSSLVKVEGRVLPKEEERGRGTTRKGSIFLGVYFCSGQ